jgi:hypothetical protein
MNYKDYHEAKGLPLIDWEDIVIYGRKDIPAEAA